MGVLWALSSKYAGHFREHAFGKKVTDLEPDLFYLALAPSVHKRILEFQI